MGSDPECPEAPKRSARATRISLASSLLILPWVRSRTGSLRQRKKAKTRRRHIAAVSLHFLYYNFVRIHQKLRVTPAMAAGVVHRLWDVEDMVLVLEKYEQNSN
jgi:hypothetical protein